MIIYYSYRLFVVYLIFKISRIFSDRSLLIYRLNLGGNKALKYFSAAEQFISVGLWEGTAKSNDQLEP